MTLFASLKVSTLGLSAQGTKMGAISDNIANVNTVGYKRTDVQFSTLVTERIRETRFTPGGVTARPRQTVDQAGQLLGTGLSTDFAVSGRGMFIVTEEAEFTAQTSEDGLAYTRAGSFRADQDGFLKNTAGYYLQGWTVNRDKQVTLDGTDAATIISSPNFSNLQPVNVNRFSNIAEQTENLRTRANLPADFTVTQRLDKPEIDPSNPFVITPGAGTATAGQIGGATITAANVIYDGAGALPAGAAADFTLTVNVSYDPDFSGPTAPVTGAFTFDAAALAAGGYQPSTGNNTVGDFIGALNTVTATLSTGEEVRFQASLSTGGNIVINATANGSAANVTSVTSPNGLTLTDSAAQAASPTDALTGADAAVATSNFTYQRPPAIAAAPNQIIVLGGAGNNVFNLNIDNQDVSFTLANTYDGATTVSTLQNLVDELNAPTTRVSVGTDVYTVDARIGGDGSLVVKGRKNGAESITIGNIAAPSTVSYDDDNATGGIVTLATIVPNPPEGVGADASITNTYDIANEQRGQFEQILNNGGGAADFTTVSTVFDALGQPHQVTLEYFRYTSDTAGPNTWAVRIGDSGIDGIKSPLESIKDPDPTVDTAATVPRFITYTGNDGNDSVDQERVTQSQTLFMKFNGDGSLESVYTDPLLSDASRVATRTTNANDPLKMIQIAVGQVQIDPTGSAGTRENENLAVAVESTTTTTGGTTTTTRVPSVFGTDGAKALVFDWDIGRPTNVRTNAPNTAVNSAFAGTGLDGLTQFDSGEASPALETYFTSQDGLRAGVLTGVALDDEGILTAFFDNGAQRAIYKVPLVSFVNFNGLINESGNIYRESRESGAAQINAAGEGFNGDLVGGALEQSNVELADEFTDMIITQQGFTANTRAITTTDEMLTDINNMVR